MLLAFLVFISWSLNAKRRSQICKFNSSTSVLSSSSSEYPFLYFSWAAVSELPQSARTYLATFAFSLSISYFTWRPLYFNPHYWIDRFNCIPIHLFFLSGIWEEISPLLLLFYLGSESQLLLSSLGCYSVSSSLLPFFLFSSAILSTFKYD